MKYTNVKFNISDPIWQKVYDAAEEKARLNVLSFCSRPVLKYKGDMQKFRDNEKKQTSIHLPVFKFLNMRDTQKKSVKKFLDNIILIILIMQFHRLKNFSLQM